MLLTMALGGYETSRIISRQSELQSGASEAEAIVQAAAAGESTDIQGIKTRLKSSLNLTDAKISVEFRYRCNAQTTLSTTSNCSPGQKTSSYVRFAMTDTYTPTWTRWGIGSTLSFSVTRMIQVG